ncbi:hypothetical protein BGZ68_007262 [Mortierella alpina]|nr:hypothetical protein BGZ68_007262 [Mortierella alpina]
MTDTLTTGTGSAVQSDATLDKHSDQQNAMTGVAIAAGAVAGMERDRTDATMMSTTPTPSFRFNFTSERFKAAVQAASSSEKNGSLEANPAMDLSTLSISASASTSASASSAAADDLPLKSMPSPATPVQKSAACVELEEISAIIQESERYDVEAPTFICRDDAPAVADLNADSQGRDATAPVVVTMGPTTTDDPAAPLLSQLATTKDESDAVATAVDDAAAAEAAAAAAADLAGMLSMSTPPRSMSSLSITADCIQKSAPMSPMTFISPKHKQQQAVQDQGQDLTCATTNTSTTTTSGSTSTASPVSVPTSPVSLSTGSGIASATATGAGHKVAGWKPLQRLMRKMTKSSNESVKPSLPRGGRIQLESS